MTAKNLRLKQIDFPLMNSRFSCDAHDALVSALARNIIAVFRQATDAEIIDGIAWYACARGFAYSLAKQFNLSLPTVSAVIAALSPNCGWARNKLDALTVLLAHSTGKRAADIKVSTYNANKAKAFAILDDSRESSFDAFSLLGGLKTRAFADNIARAESAHVTIDFHAASIARGVRLTTKTATGLSAKQYAVLECAYLHAANSLNLKPYELQAIVWLVWRRLHEVHAMHG